MAQYGQKAERLYQWAARKFAGEDLRQEIFWNATDPPEPFEANHHPPAEGSPGLIRLRLKYSQGPDRGKLRSFEEMWSNAVYELYNITGVKDFLRANADAARGTLSKEQYVTRYMEIESAPPRRRGPSIFTSSSRGQRNTALPRIRTVGFLAAAQPGPRPPLALRGQRQRLLAKL